MHYHKIDTQTDLRRASLHQKTLLKPQGLTGIKNITKLSDLDEDKKRVGLKFGIFNKRLLND